MIYCAIMTARYNTDTPGVAEFDAHICPLDTVDAYERPYRIDGVGTGETPQIALRRLVERVRPAGVSLNPRRIVYYLETLRTPPD